MTAAAAALKVSRLALSSLLNGKADLSGDMALRIEKAFGVKMDTLRRMQSSLRHRPHPSAGRQIRVRRIPQLALKQFKELMRQNSGKLKFARYDE